MAGKLTKDKVLDDKEIIGALNNVTAAFVKMKKEAVALKTVLDGAGFMKLYNALKKTEKETKKLSDKEKELAKIQKQVNVLTARQTSEYKKLNVQKQKLQAQQTKGNAAIKAQVTGNKGLINSFKNLAKSAMSYFAAMIAVQQIVRFFTQTLFNMTKKLDSLAFSMKTVIKDSSELAVTYVFLSNTATNYGHDLLTLTERYIKFRAASMQSNMAATETMKIFDSVAKAAGVLGLKTDEVNGVFLALEQMISKGKVTTEELRRQLGERLPGAMGIMAKAMGVSISQLDKMLKAGEVLSDEALPKFAVELQKAYGIEAVNTIDTLVAAHGRLKTSWVQFVDELNASDGYKAAINNWNNAFTRFRILTGDTNKTLSKFLLLTTEAGNATRAFVDNANDLIKNEDLFDQPKMMSYYKQYTQMLQNNNISLKHADRIWNEYVENRRNEFKILGEIADKTKPYDLDGLKKTLKSAENEFEQFYKVTDELTKEQAIENSGFIKEDGDKYINYLKRKLKEVTDYNDEAYTKHKEYEEKIKGLNRDATELENIENEARLTDYQNSLQGKIEIYSEIWDILNKKQAKTGDDTLSLLKAQHALELALLKQKHTNEEIEIVQAKEELAQMEYDHQREILVQRIRNTEEALKLTEEALSKEELNLKKGKVEALKLTKALNKEELNLKKEKVELETEIIQNAIDYIQGLEKAADKDELERIRKQDDEIMAALYAKINRTAVIMAKDATDQYNRNVGFAEKRRLVELKLLQSQNQMEMDALKNQIEVGNLSVEATEDVATRIWQLEEALEKGKRAMSQETKEIILENLREVQDLTEKGFSINQQILDNQTARAENTYEREMQLAGNSVAAQLTAKRKLEKEQRKIAMRQAIADKAQAIFKITLDTAAAVAKYAFITPQAILAGVLGLAAIAAVASEPLPQYEAGGITEGDPLIRVSEKGEELMVFPSGKAVLSPKKESVLAGIPAGTEIIPHDETTAILAKQAVSATYDRIDMSTTNSVLRQIRDKEAESITYENGYKLIKKKNYIGRFKV